MLQIFFCPANKTFVFFVSHRIKPEKPDYVCFKDLVRCKHGDTVLAIMTNPMAFIMYENREHILAEARRGEDQQAQFKNDEFRMDEDL